MDKGELLTNNNHLKEFGRIYLGQMHKLVILSNFALTLKRHHMLYNLQIQTLFVTIFVMNS